MYEADKSNYNMTVMDRNHKIEAWRKGCLGRCEVALKGQNAVGGEIDGEMWCGL